jgi:Rps23 Pro-64 3,4-dihydroxylase Tpa1-like proline 4-hydroxylase
MYKLFLAARRIGLLDARLFKLYEDLISSLRRMYERDIELSVTCHEGRKYYIRHQVNFSPHKLDLEEKLLKEGGN